jgi:hypothetical protein
MRALTQLIVSACVLALSACATDGGGGGSPKDVGFGKTPDASVGGDIGGTDVGTGGDTSESDGSDLPDSDTTGTGGGDGSGPDGAVLDGETGGKDAEMDADKDVPFEDPDTGCVPKCTEKECGPDHCGSICGFCEYGNSCNDEGTCIPVCDPVTPCQGKVCGPDGCGGSCGQCAPSFACGDDGLCYEAECEPQCEGEDGPKECGPDSCGGVCGKCKGTKLCDVDIGECVSNPCGSVTFQGVCESKYVVLQCVDGALDATDCKQENPQYACVWDTFTQSYTCDKPPSCLPDCSGKQCGDGGCNYSCGSCFDGWSCVEFQCVPEPGGQCGTIPAIGKCINNANYFCSNGIIQVEDCNLTGKTCKFDTGLGFTVCK